MNPKLFFKKTGTGPINLLAFHGYGQDHHAFDPWVDAHSEKYTFYCFDLFFHGQSEWPYGEKPLGKEQWRELISQFLKENSIAKFSLLGFSMGARFALAILEAFPERATELILIAPDGIKTSIWYGLATYPVLLRKLFKSMILYPRRFSRLVGIVTKTGLVDRGVLRFAASQMDTEAKRSRVYYSWVVFRHLLFDLVKITAILNEQKVLCRIYVGKLDKVVTTTSMKSFVKQLDHCEFREVDAGHYDLIRKTVKSAN